MGEGSLLAVYSIIRDVVEGTMTASAGLWDASVGGAWLIQLWIGAFYPTCVSWV